MISHNFSSYLYFLAIFTFLGCAGSKQIKNGELAFDHKMFGTAIPLLLEEFDQSSNPNVKARKAKLIAKSYDVLQKIDESVLWYDKSYQHLHEPEVLYSLGLAYKKAEKYGMALDIFDQLIKVPNYSTLATRESRICVQALQWLQKPDPTHIKKLPFNGLESDFAPALYLENSLIFTSNRPEATGKTLYPWTGEKYTDLFYVDLSSPNEVIPFDPILNSKFNDGSICFTKDLQYCFFTRCDVSTESDVLCRIMMSKSIEGFWSEPEQLPFSRAGINYGQPTLIENDSVLIFSANSEPQGTKDLYYSEWQSDGIFSTPVPMPENLNTKGNEVFPTSDGDTLYFSSDYLPGMGGFDIFKTYLRHDGTWAPPQNLKSPINSGGDDFSYLVDKSGKNKSNIIKKGYFVSSRGSIGGDDIYSFETYLAPKVEKHDSAQTQDIFVTVKTYYVPMDTDSKDVQSVKKPLGNVQISMQFQNDGDLQSLISDDRGFTFTEIQNSGEVSIVASKSGYLIAKTIFQTQPPKNSSKNEPYTHNIELILQKIEFEKEVVLENIYYDFDKWDLKDESRITLKHIIDMMQQNPKISIQINSYTDCRGDVDYNIELSQKRAQSVIDYLIQNNIDASRLKAKGYGESNPVISCPCQNCSEVEHQQNRRTTFKILKG
ncbi:MAG: OmpA family protein [Saprospiraceae bacterium]